jgi:tungstate transport system ATP-binding protein
MSSAPDNSAPAVRIDGLERRLNEGFRLSIPTLEITAGETLAIVGPTGSGKSTLLKLLAGIAVPDRGTITIDGAPLTVAADNDALRRRIAWMPQTPLMQRGSLRYNVEYGLRLRDGDRAAHAPRVDAMLARLNLTPLAAQSARSLSGGQTQLAALARALVIEPELLLVDEPTANLDPARTAIVEETLRATAAAGRTTIVWATHNLFQARRTADRVCLLLDGAPVELAATEEFFTHPRDPRTADFTAGKMIY